MSDGLTIANSGGSATHKELHRNLSTPILSTTKLASNAGKVFYQQESTTTNPNSCQSKLNNNIVTTLSSKNESILLVPRFLLF